MDASALIFVALAVAWGAYLIPLALKHHDESARSRTVDRFSHTVRVLARREAADKSGAQLVTPGRPAVSVDVAAPAARPSRAERRAAKASAKAARRAEVAAAAPAPAVLSPAQARARRAAVKRATKRRRNVLAAILVVNLAVVTVAAVGVVSWWYVAIPVGLLVAWLVACRVMVKGERRAHAPARRAAAAASAERPAEPASAPVAEEPQAADPAVDPMEDTSTGIAAVVDPAMWDPVPVTLPTYVSKPAAARRSVRTIDLDSTGVWTSGRTEADAKIAREADQADQAARKARRDGDDQRAVGS